MRGVWILVGIEAGAVVGDTEPRVAVLGFDRDLDLLRIRVLDDVAERLLRRAEEQGLHVLGQVVFWLDSQARLQPARRTRSKQVAERCLEPLPVELGRVDLDEETAQLADSLSRLARSVPQ